MVRKAGVDRDDLAAEVKQDLTYLSNVIRRSNIFLGSYAIIMLALKDPRVSSIVIRSNIC